MKIVDRCKCGKDCWVESEPEDKKELFKNYLKGIAGTLVAVKPLFEQEEQCAAENVDKQTKFWVEIDEFTQRLEKTFTIKRDSQLDIYLKNTVSFSNVHPLYEEGYTEEEIRVIITKRLEDENSISKTERS